MCNSCDVVLCVIQIQHKLIIPLSSSIFILFEFIKSSSAKTNAAFVLLNTNHPKNLKVLWIWDDKNVGGK